MFGYGLALTLTLLWLASWLLLKRRRTRNWLFVWGFAFEATFAFFVESAPYLTSYGGYVQYGVGVILTLVGARAAIKALHTYREHLALVEARLSKERRTGIVTDEALDRLARMVCPGGERASRWTIRPRTSPIAGAGCSSAALAVLSGKARLGDFAGLAASDARPLQSRRRWAAFGWRSKLVQF